MNGNGIIAKIGRLAVSKAAGFGYAVAVGVAGNLAFNFVQEHRATPVVAPPGVSAPAPAAAALPKREPPRPASEPVPAAVPVPPAASALPNPDALPAPPLKPAALPSERASAPRETPRLPEPRPTVLRLPPTVPAAVVPPAPEAPPALSPPPAAQPQTAALPPLGPPIDVASEPVPPAHLPTAAHSGAPPATAPSPPAHALRAAPTPEQTRGFALSDLWHPYYRAVKDGLLWAGNQLPAIGGSGNDEPPTPKLAVPPAPIPLLPAASTAERSASGDAGGRPLKTGRPGPGSGGLY